MFNRILVLSVKVRMPFKGCYGHLEFRLATGNAGTGCTSEAHLNMDVNMCRLPDEIRIMPKFLVPLADIMWHPLLTDSADILSKQVKRQFIIKKNGLLRTVGISHPKKSNLHRIPQNFFILKTFPHSQAPMDYSGICPILV